ncbi:Eco57I restriction-modification methylase domain-containing protein [Haloarcula sp. CBA1115]|uniref:Eco57I restriction-modification methylase domain-containing protein n=2 Tax=unclassified Haloarcula TaxID=2624677 RepID=UPI000A410DE5|nr:hypothetical protein [Haloarcula sp. CBA1115]
MVTQQISAADVRSWNSLSAIADSLIGRGLEKCEQSDDEIELVFKTGSSVLLTTVPEGESPEVALSLDQFTDRHELVIAVARDWTQFDLYARHPTETGLGKPLMVHFGFNRADIKPETSEVRRVVERLNQIDGYDSSSLPTLFDDEALIERVTTRYEEMVKTVVEAIQADPDVDSEARQRYAQRLVNRFLYLYLLQEAEVLPDSFLEKQQGQASLKGTHAYEEIYAPLFAGEPSNDVARDLDPYLQSFLFEKTQAEADNRVAPPSSESNANELLWNIVGLLRDFDWELGGPYDIQHTTKVTPRVIGHALERYINKQHTAAYHTPDQLQDSLVTRTIRKSLLHDLNEEFDADFESLSAVFGTDTSTSSGEPRLDAIDCLWNEVLPNFRVVDPAVGSGSFISKAQEFLADIYTECLEHLNTDQRNLLENTPLIEHSDSDSSQTRLLAAQHNLYGVDLNPEAIELTRFRLLLSAFENPRGGRIEMLQALEYHTERNFFTGNSLIGISQRPHPNTVKGQQSLEDFEQITNNYRNLIQEYRQSSRDDISDLKENIFEQTESLSRQLTLTQFEGLESLEGRVTADSQVEHTIGELSPFHWIVEFPNIMLDGGFDAVITNPPWNTLKGQKRKSSSKSGPSERRANYEEHESSNGELFEIQCAYLTEHYQTAAHADPNLSELFVERAMEIAAPQAMVSILAPGVLFQGSKHEILRRKILEETSLYRILGFENHGIFEDFDRRYEFGILEFQNTGPTNELHAQFRQTSLDALSRTDTELPVLTRSLLDSYSRSILAFPPVENEDDVRALETLVDHNHLDDKDGWQIAPTRGIHQTRQANTLFDEPGDYPIYRGRNIYQYTHDSTYYDVAPPSYWGLDESAGDQSAKHVIRERELRNLTGNRPIEIDDHGLHFENGETIPRSEVPMPYDEYRIAYRDIAGPSNERAVIATVIPPDVLTVNTIHTIHPFRWKTTDPANTTHTPDNLFEQRYTPQEIFCLLGILNSTPFDYLMRSKIKTHLSDYLVKESQAPHLSPVSNLGETIWTLAARLTCYGDCFNPLQKELNVDPIRDIEKRAAAQAEIDAAVFLAYGFEDRDVVWSILDSLPRVRSPRVLDESYFERVVRVFSQQRGEF